MARVAAYVGLLLLGALAAGLGAAAEGADGPPRARFVLGENSTTILHRHEAEIRDHFPDHDVALDLGGDARPTREALLRLVADADILYLSVHTKAVTAEEDEYPGGVVQHMIEVAPSDENPNPKVFLKSRLTWGSFASSLDVHEHLKRTGSPGPRVVFLVGCSTTDRTDGIPDGPRRLARAFGIDDDTEGRVYVGFSKPVRAVDVDNVFRRYVLPEWNKAEGGEEVTLRQALARGLAAADRANRNFLRNFGATSFRELWGLKVVGDADVTIRGRRPPGREAPEPEPPVATPTVLLDQHACTYDCVMEWDLFPLEKGAMHYKARSQNLRLDLVCDLGEKTVRGDFHGDFALAYDKLWHERYLKPFDCSGSYRGEVERATLEPYTGADGRRHWRIQGEVLLHLELRGLRTQKRYANREWVHVPAEGRQRRSVDAELRGSTEKGGFVVVWRSFQDDPTKPITFRLLLKPPLAGLSPK